MWTASKIVGSVGLAVLTLIGYKQTPRQTSKIQITLKYKIYGHFLVLDKFFYRISVF